MSYALTLPPPMLPKPLSEIYFLPTFLLPTTLDDVRECFQLLGDIEAHAARNSALLRTTDITACRTWAALVARNIEVPTIVDIVNPQPLDRRHRHKKSTSKTSNSTLPAQLILKKPSRSPSEPATLHATAPVHASPSPSIPSLFIPPPPDNTHEKTRSLGDEQRHSRDHTRARIHAIVEDEVQPLRDKLALLNAHVQTIKHKRSSRSVKTVHQTPHTSEEAAPPIPLAHKGKERESQSVPQDFQMAGPRGRPR